MQSTDLIHSNNLSLPNSYDYDGALSLMRRPIEVLEPEEVRAVTEVWSIFLEYFPRYIDLADSLHRRKVLTGQWGTWLLEQQVKTPCVTLFHINLARVALAEVMSPATDLLESSPSRQAKLRHLHLIKVVLVGKELAESPKLPGSFEEAFELELFEKIRLKHLERVRVDVEPLLKLPFADLVYSEEKEAVMIYKSVYMRELSKVIAESERIRILFKERNHRKNCFEQFEVQAGYNRCPAVKLASRLAHFHFSRLAHLTCSPDLEACFGRFIQVIGVGPAGVELLPFPKDGQLFHSTAIDSH